MRQVCPGAEFFIEVDGLLGSQEPEHNPKAPAKVAAPGKPQIQANPAHETNGLDVLALCIMRKYFDGKHEIWLRPFLQRFRNEHAELSEQERKSALTKLQTSGAITIQKRPGQPNDYSVIVLNWNNDLVQAQNT